MLMLRVLVAAMLVACTTHVRAADSGYFVAIAVLNDDYGDDYETFLEKVKPVWQRHGMSVVLRAKTKFVLEAHGTPVPEDITVLRYETRAGFNAYLKDPEYLDIKGLRENALDNLLIIEAQAFRTDGLPLLSKTPMTLVRFDKRRVQHNDPALVLMTEGAFRVRGRMDAWTFTQQMRFAPLSFDDNPMQGATIGAMLVMASDLIR